MNAHHPVGIVMVEDDEGHARLIEKNIRRAGISNDIRHFTDGTSALDYLFQVCIPSRRSPGPLTDYTMIDRGSGCLHPSTA